MYKFKMLFIFLLFPLFLMASNLEKITVQLHWKHQFQYAGFYAALKNGYYKDLGLDVQLKEWNPSINKIDELLKGKSHFAVTAADKLTDVFKSEDLIIVSAYLKRTPVALATKPEIYFPSDLENKKIMGIEKDIKSAVFYKMWQVFNVDLSKLNIIPHDFTMKSFIDGDVDAIQIYTTDQMYELASKKIRFNILDANSYGLDFYDLMVLTSSSLASNKPELVLNFKEATNRGWIYALKNKEEIVNYIYKNFNSQNKSKEALLFEANRLEKLILMDDNTLGEVKEEKLKDIALVHLEMNNIQSVKNINKSIFSYKNFHRSLNLTKEEKQYLLNKKTITVCSQPDNIKIKDKTFFKSIDKRIIEDISKKLDIQIKYAKVKDWDEALEKTLNKKCELISTIRATKKRLESLNFIDTYYIAQPLVLVTTNDTFFINDISKLKNKKVAILHESLLIPKIKKLYPNLEIIETYDPKDSLKMVKNKEVFAYIDIPFHISYHIKQLGFVDLKINGTFDIHSGLTMATNKDEIILKNILDKSMNLLSSEYIDKLVNEWYSIKYEKGVDYSLTLKIFFFALFVVLLLLFWNQKIRKNNILLKKMQKKLKTNNEKLIKISSTDRLTKLYNRHKLDEVLESEFNRYKRYENTFGIILVDVDYFKSVNDTYGHHIGDEVLIQIADILRKTTRTTDTVGRWGGEEFLIICPETSLEDIEVTANKCRVAIENFEFNHVGKKTASFGVSSIEYTKSIDELIVQADKNLYKAKNSGRNKVISSFS